MADNEQAETPPRRRGGLLTRAAAGLALLGAGGGGAFALMQAGLLPGLAHGAAKKDANLPQLVRKGERDPYAPASEAGGEEAGGGADVEGEGGSEYRTSYYNFAEDFTSNLKNSSALVQMSLACSTRRDGRVLIWLRKHELAIRSEVLVVMADTPEEDAFTPEGKVRLARRLTAAINRVLIRTEGFGGVDAVYFKSFLVQ